MFSKLSGFTEITYRARSTEFSNTHAISTIYPTIFLSYETSCTLQSSSGKPSDLSLISDFNLLLYLYIKSKDIANRASVST